MRTERRTEQLVSVDTRYHTSSLANGAKTAAPVGAGALGHRKRLARGIDVAFCEDASRVPER